MGWALSPWVHSQRFRRPGSLSRRPVESGHPSPPGTTVHHPQPPRILAVDDEPAVRALLVRALEEAGYVIVAVPHGQAAVEAQQAAAFDLVITNTFMPSLPGEELILHLRRLFPALPILHLDDVKPFSLTTLLEAVARAVPEQPLKREA